MNHDTIRSGDEFEKAFDEVEADEVETDEDDIAGASFYVPEHQVLQAALDEDLTEVVVVGIDADGDLYVASSHSVATARTMLERGIQQIDDMLEEGDGHEH